MASFDHAVKNRLSIASLITAALLIGCVWVFSTDTASQAAQVRGTNIEARICDGVTGASIAITSPPSDTVVTVSQVTITGTVANATQIEERINGQYNGTIPLNANATTFEAVLTVPVGTSTIELIATDVCGVSDGHDTLIITYAPPAEPPAGNGGSSSPQGEGGGGAPVNDQLEPIALGPLEMFDRTWRAITRALDFDPGSNSSSWKNPFRASFLIAGIGLVLLASFIINWVWSWGIRRRGAIVYVPDEQKKGSHISKRSVLFIARVVGAICIIVAFVL